MSRLPNTTSRFRRWLLASAAGVVSRRGAERGRGDVQHVLDATRDGIYGVDSTGRITFVNRALCELVGADRADALVGRNHHQALGHLPTPGSAAAGTQPGTRGKETLERCGACAAVALAAPAHGDLFLEGVGQEPLPVGYSSRPLAAAGRYQGTVITIHDMREHHALEAQRRRAQAELNQLVSVVEASPNLVVVGRSDGQVQWMNTSGRSLLGIGADEDVSALTIGDMFPPQELLRIYAEDMPALVSTGRWQGQRTLRSRAGDAIPVAVASRLHLDDGFPEGYYVTEIMRDLRPQLEQERSLRLSERRLSTAETIARMGSWEWNPETDHVQWSRGLYQLYGMAGSGVETVETWLMTVHPDDQQRVREICTRVAEGNGGLDFVCRSSRADGTPMVVHSRGGIVEEPGAPRVIVGTLVDITEQHAALSAVQQSQELTRRILESAGDAYVQFSADGLVTEWNVQAEETFGLTRAEAMGQPVVALVTAPDKRESLERLLGLPGGPAHAGQPTEHFEQPMLHRAGREFPAEVTAWTTDDGAQRVFSCVIRDISERQAAERAKNEFVSVVGHELRTPLTSIHGALGLLRAGLLGELNTRGKRMVDIAAHNTDRLVRLVNDILDIERLESGKVDLELQECDVAVLAERSLEVMRSLADGAGVRLTLDARPAVHLVDPDRIEQAVTNLLSNATKFSPAGSEVLLTVRSDADGLTIRVRDQGRGIPVEDLERIFDRFQQVDGSDARDKGGTGLGLAICRTITEQHGGRIWAENGPGGGAVFTMTIPATRGAGPEVGAEETGGPMVVVCSEDALVRARIGEVLLSRGYDPIEVTAGSLLLDAALQHHPAAILFEQRTPTVAGWEAVVGLRAHHETRDIPVVFLNFDGDTVFARSEGAAIDEPLDIGGLLSAVEEVIGNRETGPELLLVEDDQGLAAVLAEGFRQLGIRVHHAPTARQALALCSHIVPDLVVLDLQLPDQDGFAVVAQFRQDARLRGVPLAVYSARDVDEADRKRLRLGRTGFFTKGRVNPDEFEQHVMELLGHLTQAAKETAHGSPPAHSAD
ncbi:PAS domain S-box protein [Arthrobacter sp. C9C5]|uniref:PAS domain S-box protein n=1 Tax=Arthrobacter sp. C9C5 TaxID=2735267 RepID=UPI001584DA68|nr:PAS domain S-box protein [Arthrobacter sp. C9C5]NUU30625.1 PAS domain S-box protein [Arthrobacter sp. C9C5]